MEIDELYKKLTDKDWVKILKELLLFEKYGHPFEYSVNFNSNLVTIWQNGEWIGDYDMVMESFIINECVEHCQLKAFQHMLFVKRFYSGQLEFVPQYKKPPKGGFIR